MILKVNIYLCSKLEDINAAVSSQSILEKRNTLQFSDITEVSFEIDSI